MPLQQSGITVTHLAARNTEMLQFAVHDFTPTVGSLLCLSMLLDVPVLSFRGFPCSFPEFCTTLLMIILVPFLQILSSSLLYYLVYVLPLSCFSDFVQ